MILQRDLLDDDSEDLTYEVWYSGHSADLLPFGGDCVQPLCSR